MRLSHFQRGDELFVLVTIADLSALKHAEKTLRQSEERYRRLVELSPYAVFVNRQNRITYANLACNYLLGATQPDELIGRSPFDFFHPDIHPIMQEQFQQAIQTLATFPPTGGKIIQLDGAVIDVESMGVAYQDEEGIAIQVVLTDITERKHAAQTLEQRVAERTRELEQHHQISTELSRILSLLNSNQPVATILNHIVTQAMRQMQASTCSIFFLEEQGSQLVVPVSQGYLSDELKQSSLPLDEETASGFVTLSQQMLIISDFNSPVESAEPKLISRRLWLQTARFSRAAGDAALHQIQNRRQLDSVLSDSPFIYRARN